MKDRREDEEPRDRREKRGGCGTREREEGEMRDEGRGKREEGEISDGGEKRRRFEMGKRRGGD